MFHRASSEFASRALAKRQERLYLEVEDAAITLNWWTCDGAKYCIGKGERSTGNGDRERPAVR
jgi:hypothetical protein